MWILLWGATAWAGAQVCVTVEGLRSDRGLVRLALFDGPEGFPQEGRRAAHQASVPIAGGRSAHCFEGVATGTWALSLLHDEDADEQLDTNSMGMPREGWGASNDASRFLGPPRFDDAAFRVDGARVDLVLRPRYLLPLTGG